MSFSRHWINDCLLLIFAFSQLNNHNCQSKFIPQDQRDKIEYTHSKFVPYVLKKIETFTFLTTTYQALNYHQPWLILNSEKCHWSQILINFNCLAQSTGITPSNFLHSISMHPFCVLMFIDSILSFSSLTWKLVSRLSTPVCRGVGLKILKGYWC